MDHFPMSVTPLTKQGNASMAIRYEAAQVVFFEHLTESGVTVVAATRTGSNTGHNMEDRVQMGKNSVGDIIIRLGDEASKKVGFSSGEVGQILDDLMSSVVQQNQPNPIRLPDIQRKMHVYLRAEIERRTTSNQLAIAMESSLLAHFKNISNCKVQLSLVGDSSALKWGRARRLWSSDPQMTLEVVLAAQSEHGQPSQLLGSYRHVQPTICPHTVTVSLLPGEMIILGSDGGLPDGMFDQLKDIISPVKKRWQLASTALNILEATRLKLIENARRNRHQILDDQSIVILFREDAK